MLFVSAKTEQQDIVEQSFENSDYTRIIELGKHRANTKIRSGDNVDNFEIISITYMNKKGVFTDSEFRSGVSG